jgi:hypothetical protein
MMNTNTVSSRLARVWLIGLLFQLCHCAEGDSAEKPVVFGEYSGSSPCGEGVRQFLPIPEEAELPLVWQLSLYDTKTAAPATYALRCEFRLPASTQGEKAAPKILEKRGAMSLSQGTKSNPQATVYELEGAFSLLKLNADVLHLLNRDRSLMVGNGGWSYTLYRTAAAEKIAPPPRADKPSVSYTLTPLASGPSVLGVFEGRSPCYRIADALKLPVEDCMKAKWRVTLYQDPSKQTPTTYKIEGTLHRAGAREGRYAIVQGSADDPQAVVYQLAPTQKEAGLHLLKGDDNVLFFLDADRKPLVGHADFSYTLNRK